MQSLVLAAGKGTRMRGLCDRLAKPMLPLANVPVIEHILDALALAGITRAHVVVGHCADQIRDHFARKPHRLSPNFIDQVNPTGTASAALLGKTVLRDEPFLLAFGDIIVSRANYAALVSDFQTGDWDAMLTTRKVPDPCHGAAVYVEGGRVVRLVEKPKPGTSTTDLDNAGLFIFPPEIFGILERLKPSARGEYELTDALSSMIAANMRVGAHNIEGFWFNLTDPEALIASNEAVLNEVGPSRLSASSASIRDPVSIGRNCRIGRCELGPAVSIGDGCVIEDGCAVSHALIMPNAHISSGARIEYAILAPGAEVALRSELIGRADQAIVVRGTGS
jgi:NDP-sugar pyrophosphorylase family protein